MKMRFFEIFFDLAAVSWLWLPCPGCRVPAAVSWLWLWLWLPFLITKKEKPSNGFPLSVCCIIRFQCLIYRFFGL